MNPWIPHLLRAGGGGGGAVLPPTGRTMLANLTSSLILDEGTGGPTWSRATKAWGFNELGYLEELASGCVFFGGARLVRNLAPKSETFTTGWSFGRAAMPVDGKLLDSVDAGTHRMYFSATIPGPGAYMAWFEVKAAEWSKCAVGVHANTEIGGARVLFDLSTGVGEFHAGYIDGSFTSTLLADGWVKVIVRGNLTSTSIGVFLYTANDSGVTNYVGDGTKGILVRKAMVCDVTGYDASYLPEYVSVGVEASPYFGAGIDGAKYFETDWQGAPLPAASLLGFRREAAATNNLLHSRDLSNAVWSTKTNITAAKTATGLDGIANTATTLTATAADAIILQPITLASAARCASAYVKRRTGTGTISFTQDGGSTWTDITSLINSSTWSRVEITATLANPSVGFKIGTSGDAIDVDVVQNEAGAVATSPIVTTTATVTRNAESLSYQTASNIDFAVGTIYGELQCSGSLVSRFAVEVGLATFQLSTPDANTDFRAYDTTLTAIKTGLSDITTGSRKRVVSWGPSGLSVTGDGLSPTTVAFDGSYGSGATVSIGRNINGYIGPVAIYNYQMTDAELQALTT